MNEMSLPAAQIEIMLEKGQRPICKEELKDIPIPHKQTEPQLSELWLWQEQVNTKH